MRVLVTLTSRFTLTSDGSLWAENPTQSYAFWTRYLDVYDEVTLLVRARRSDVIPVASVQANGPHVIALPVPFYDNPLSFLRKLPTIRGIIREALLEPRAVHLRLPAPLGTQLMQMLPREHPFAVEVLGSPYHTFAPGSVQHPLRPLFRRVFTYTLQRACRRASATAYVTQQGLQAIYPPRPDAYTTHFSDVVLADDAFADAPRPLIQSDQPVRLLLVGSLAQMRKAPDVLLQAVAQVVHGDGLNLQLTLVGDGKHRPELEALAASLGIAEHVYFAGQLQREGVQRELENADLFVLPSYQEGLPRALLEAMARGLPAIASDVGGVPELLPDAVRVSPGDVDALQRKIAELVRDPSRMAALSAENLRTAQQYHEATLRERRIAFYETVKAQTELYWREQL